ncbi:MAG TPA: Uma2 family endonuclease [Methylomirabilota bacterium]|jgi:Uma2 family endonuclease|nr:Uma2 family endonuclease [Methylomirabilota bacterium]
MAAPPRTRRWSRQEYDRLVELGVLHEDEPIELIGGELIVAEPKGSPHATGVSLAAEALRAAFGEGWLVRVQDPVALDDESEPEPDVAVVPGRPRDYRAAHPSRPALVVEVAESSLAFDRNVKGSLYARAGLADYWIVNLVDRTLEVHRPPVRDASAPFGWRYGSVQILGPDAAASPLARPAARVAVADLLP